MLERGVFTGSTEPSRNPKIYATGIMDINHAFLTNVQSLLDVGRASLLIDLCLAFDNASDLA